MAPPRPTRNILTKDYAEKKKLIDITIETTTLRTTIFAHWRRKKNSSVFRKNPKNY